MHFLPPPTSTHAPGATPSRPRCFKAQCSHARFEEELLIGDITFCSKSAQKSLVFHLY
jgi:hypothetical protein